MIWFDEELEAREVERVEEFLSRGSCEVVLVVGTTALFEYIITWARRAKGQNGRLIEVNPEETGLSPFATESIRSKATVAVKQLVDGFVS